MTQREAGHVLVVEGVVHLAEERYQREAAGITVRLRLTDTGSRPHIVLVQQHEVELLTAEPHIVLAVELDTGHGVGTVLALLEVVSGNEVPHPLRPVLLLGLHGILRTSHGTFRNRIGEDALLLLRVVQTEGSLDVQVLQGVDVDIGITEHTPVGVAVVLVTLQTSQRVLTVGVAAYRTGKLAGGGIDGQRGVELQHVLQEAARGLHLTGAVDGEVLTDGHDVAVLDLHQLVLSVHTTREALEVGVLDDTLVLIVS